MRARFLEPQPPARLVEKGGRVYVFLCADEKIFYETCDSVEGNSDPVTVYEYDYHEFAEDVDNIDTQDVMAHPEKYMSYTHETETIESKLAKLTEQLNALSVNQLNIATKEA